MVGEETLGRQQVSGSDGNLVVIDQGTLIRERKERDDLGVMLLRLPCRDSGQAHVGQIGVSSCNSPRMETT